ncbi:MAG: hypothetical protein QM809_03190 [Gordonia sp. (in: high G+C Gram-positive bacteria)]|uniref:hypothetical protein n=1 Tax=Gordonia sp. (in: high G+C Gram-positive bacteria) TaxID=84139 RepID=UPI0039E5993A
MTRSPHSPRPAPPYRQPIARGQTYPPLGFADDGTPRYRYEPPRSAAPSTPEPLEPAPVSAPEPPRGDPVNRTLVGVGGVVALVLLVAVVLALVSGGDPDESRLAQRSDPPPVQPTDDPYLDGLEDDSPFTIEPRPSTPRRTPSRPAGPGSPTVYEVTTEGRATVLYRDGEGIEVVSVQGGVWTERATTHGVARVSVLVAEGSAASCKITVDREVVAEQELRETQGGLRLLVCQG